MLSETHFDNFLGNIADTAVTVKKSNSYGNLNSFNFTGDDTPLYKQSTGIENDDLSALLDCCHTNSLQSPGKISLAVLAENHFSDIFSSISCNRIKRGLSDQFVSCVKNDDSDEVTSLDFLDILLEDYKDGNEISSKENLLNPFNWDSLSVEDAEKKEQNHEIEKKVTLDEDLIPDINLSFCIKKNVKKDICSSESSSPGSSDSGYAGHTQISDEIDLSSVKTVSSYYNEISFENTQVKSTLTNAKSSLFSRAISARPRTDKSRVEKLKNIRSELLKKCFPPPISDYKLFKNSRKIEQQIIDQSDQCAITCTLLRVSKYAIS